jgi:malate/lactate dehydrogenase
MVLGEHVYNLVMLFSSIRISGKQVEITQDVKNQLNEYVPTMLKAFIKVSTNRTAGWTSAAGIATLVQAITNDSDRIIPCSTTLCGQYGFTGISMGVPVVLGSGGIKEIIELDLPDDEKTQMNKAAQSLYPAALTIEQMVTG